MASSSKSKFDEKVDYYEMLGVKEDASESDINRGFRKKTFECHPDRFPDDPLAAEKFHKLEEAQKILTDPSLRVQYDKKRNAKLLQKRKMDQMDKDRRKLKEDLDARENAAESAAKKQRTQKEDASFVPLQKKHVEHIKSSGGYDELYKLKERLKKKKVKSKIAS